MGPFEGAEVSVVGILIFAAIAFLAWVFKAGRRAARKDETPKLLANHTVSKGEPPPGFEHFLACDRCGKETDKLLRREQGPELCEQCFKAQPIETNTSSRHTNTSGKSSVGG